MAANEAICPRAGCPATQQAGEELMPKILVIDDNVEMRRLLQTMLTRAGHEPAAAADGEEGLRKCEAERFDLVLLDIWMPEVDGISVLKDLLARSPDLPVIIMSGGSDRMPLEYSSALAATHGATSVLFKPFHREELLAAVETALGS